MGRRRKTTGFSRQVDDMRDRVADRLASGSAPRSRGAGMRRLLWLGLGIGIGAALGGGRMRRMLPPSIAARMDGLLDRIGSSATELVDKLDLDRSSQEPDEPVDQTPGTGQTIDLTDPVASEVADAAHHS